MSPSTYHSLTVDLAESDSEPVQELLHDSGALGLEVRDAEAPPMPGVRGPAPGEAIVIGFFDAPEPLEEARALVAAEYPAARMAVEVVAQQDWSNAWKALIRSVQVGRLWVGPPWDLEHAPADRIRIVIEPKMAFGTGDHPTTSLCLEAVDAYLSSHPGASVLDVGTGSGVLAIAARKLGARRAVGIDNDPMSVTLAIENATLNGVPDVELSGRGPDDIPGPVFDLVVANILANTLVDLAPQIAPRVGDRLVLGGLLTSQGAEVTAAYERLGLILEGTASQGDWIRLDLRRA